MYHGENRSAYRVLVAKPGGDYYENLDVGGKVSKSIFEKYDEVVCTGLIWLRIRTSRRP
jgi:hypothetical protein